MNLWIGRILAQQRSVKLDKVLGDRVVRVWYTDLNKPLSKTVQMFDRMIITKNNTSDNRDADSLFVEVSKLRQKLVFSK